MAPPVHIDDPADPRLHDFVALRDPDLRDEGVFIVEGELAIRALLGSSYTARSFLLIPAMWERLAPALGSTAGPVYVAPLEIVRAVVGFDLHRGAVASATRPALVPLAQVVAATDTLLALEGVNDHENLGSLFRNAAGLGAGGVVLDPTCADPLYRRSVRVSLGHVLRVPFTRTSPWPEAIEVVHAAGFEVVALTPGASRPLHGWHPRSRVAFMVGAEGPGLTPQALEAADTLVSIPMAAGVDSLNVATAAAVALHWAAVARR